ncbi:MAG: hypothetical protein AAF630_12880 [Cyanobacteria bacterium P01_C01_bin.38]
MSNRDPVTLWLVIIVSVAATIIGMRNLAWFIDTINGEQTNIQRTPN